MAASSLKKEKYRSPDRVLYHGTTEPFTQFEHTADLGFHFGSKKAAQHRLKQTGGDTPQIRAVPFTPEGSVTHKQAAVLLSSGTPMSRDEQLFCLIASRSSGGKDNLADIISTLTEDEWQSAYQEYASKPLSLTFLQAVQSQRQPPHFRIYYNEQWVSSASSLEHAQSIQDTLRTQPLKAAKLQVKNLARLPDLGTWPPRDIANALPMSAQEKTAFNALDDNESRYAHLRDWFASKDIQGIVYTNAVEDSGKDSVIIFNAEHIQLLHNSYPSAHPHLDRVAENYNMMLKNIQDVLDPDQLHNELYNALEEDFVKIEDLFELRAKIEGNPDLFDTLLLRHYKDFATIPTVMMAPAPQPDHVPDAVYSLSRGRS